MSSRSLRVFSLAILGVAVSASAASKQPWISLDASGKLVYRTLPHGDRIVDFSYAGYMGGGVPLPRLPVVRTLTPSGGDDSAAIQQAIDQVAAQAAKDHRVGAPSCSRPALFSAAKPSTSPPRESFFAAAGRQQVAPR
jgi:hypothetical protein